MCLVQQAHRVAVCCLVRTSGRVLPSGLVEFWADSAETAATVFIIAAAELNHGDLRVTPVLRAAVLADLGGDGDF